MEKKITSDDLFSDMMDEITRLKGRILRIEREANNYLLLQQSELNELKISQDNLQKSWEGLKEQAIRTNTKILAVVGLIVDKNFVKQKHKVELQKLHKLMEDNTKLWSK